MGEKCKSCLKDAFDMLAITDNIKTHAGNWALVAGEYQDLENKLAETEEGGCIIGGALEHLKNEVKDIRKAIENKDAELVKAATYRFNLVLSTLGVDSMADLCQKEAKKEALK